MNWNPYNEVDLSTRKWLREQNFSKLAVVNLSILVDISQLERLIHLFTNDFIFLLSLQEIQEAIYLLLCKSVSEGYKNVAELISIDSSGIFFIENPEGGQDRLFFLLQRFPRADHYSH
jgi:hypothetical protein